MKCTRKTESWQRRLEAKQPLTLDSEELLTTLVEKIGESPVAKRGTGSAKSADKKDSKQSVANPAIQQQITCPVCKGAHDISHCQKEKALLKREAKERCEKLPGGTGAQNTSKRSQQVDTETEEESAPAFTGCVICLEETYINICHIPKRDATTKRNMKSRTQWLF